MLYLCFFHSRYYEAPVEYMSYRQKDGALLAIGTLCDKLKQTEPYKSELERMLVQHVFPEFGSPVGHLRAKVRFPIQFICAHFLMLAKFTLFCFLLLLGIWRMYFKLVSCHFTISTQKNMLIWCPYPINDLGAICKSWGIQVLIGWSELLERALLFCWSLMRLCVFLWYFIRNKNPPWV